MKTWQRSMNVWVGFSVLLFLHPMQSLQAQEPAMGGGIATGHVLDTNNGQPIPGAHIEGHVADSVNADPITGVFVNAMPLLHIPHMEGGASEMHLWTVTDEQGEFVLENAAGGEYAIVVVGHGNHHYTTNSWTAPHGQTDENGYYRIEGVPSGLRPVFAMAPNYLPEQRLASIAANQTVRMDLALTPTETDNAAASTTWQIY